MQTMMKWIFAGGVAAMMALAPGVASAGDGVGYTWDEAKNPLGPNKCKTDKECDGLRTCSPHGWCQGTARPVAITPAPVPPAWFSVKAVDNNGGCIEVRDGKLVNAACAKNGAQMWWATAQSGYRSLKHKATGKCLSVNSERVLSLTDCGLVDSQFWAVVASEKKGAVTLKNKSLGDGYWLGGGGIGTASQLYQQKQGVPPQAWSLNAE